MAHALARRRALPNNQRRDGLCELWTADVLGGLLLPRASNLPDHHNSVRVRVVLEHLQNIDEGRAVHRVAADADACGLPDSQVGQLPYCLVGQRARSGDDSHPSSLMNVTWHNTHLEVLPRGDNSWTVRPN